MANHSQEERKSNRLIHEKSPYLLQHAYNPVDWYPWSSQAFEKAKIQNKPVFVSIGYSTCHWCHVMREESFEDSQVAELLNRAFVCIKIDREERPDLDAVYMAVCQAMGRSCGWPLNVIMTPNKNPFFVTSYIPKDNRYGVVGMVNLIPQIEQMWKARQDEFEAMGMELKQQVTIQPSATKEEPIGEAEFNDAYDQLFLAFDHENAGFGSAPKFPTPHNLLFLLRYYHRTKQNAAWTMVERTLRAMRSGGIFDQVGFGFHRYSTDAKWLVPHFEKMLYDQALLALVYIEAYQLSGATEFKVTAKETLDYVLRDLSSPQGGFYSAQDADSEGEEGKYYLWTQEEIKQALPPELCEFATKLFGVKAEGNYYEQFKRWNGKNILHLAMPLEQVASESNLTVDVVMGGVEKIKNILFQAREKRVHPAIDDKVLVDWNGLTIAALSRAGQVLGEYKYLEAAQKATAFILAKMRSGEGEVFHSYTKGKKANQGFLDDYAFLVFGLIEIYEACFAEKYLHASVELTRKMIAEFWDDENGGFYFTSRSGDEAVPRLKQGYDGALPSGNSVALYDLLRLARLSGEASFEQYAIRLLQAFAYEVRGYPMGHTFMLAGLGFALGPAFNVVLTGNLQEKDTQTMLEALRKNYMPSLTVKFWIPEEDKVGSTYGKIDGKATAYVCKNQTCMPPTNEPERMLEYLKV